MNNWFFIMGMGWLLLSSSHVFGSQAAFTSEMYLRFNPIIVEGVLISDSEVPKEEELEGQPGWTYPTNLACVIIEKVLRQGDDFNITAGDTICVRYATSNNLTNPDKPTLMTIGCSATPLNIPLGTTRLHCFNIGNDGKLKIGAWFALNKTQEAEVLDLLEYYDLDHADWPSTYILPRKH